MTTSALKDIVKIVASDLDGTLLAPNHQLSDFTKQTLTELHQQGYTFIFATGRHHVDVAGIREQTGIPAYMITSNGARVHDLDDNLTYAKNIPAHLVQQIVDVLKDDPEIFIHIYMNDEWLMNRDDEDMKNFHDKTGFTYRLFDINNAPQEGIAKIFFTHPNQEHEYLVPFEDKLNELLGDKLNIAFSTPWCLEVMAAEVSKGHALQAVAQSMNLGLEHCVAFGDGMNDAEMLAMAGKGLVMGTSHEKVLKALPDNEVIGSNADDAVAHYLHEHLL
ncbi:Cof-type HAD-IIB family hydrolase [Vibrio sp. 99-70-13A1]|uniref:Cof-type HAD-IIB family hydrolase n=1 Tax=Vibrio sp. 99-70-13A1 TaxID=2607601 RepID=UPI001493B004|nr:Cof-type HAD-IIB family hydrolase [Vibrio sp. 99-70-13A1]NOH96483.1 Cof-type HAD-IIB family hydrolase [Vibrio sp. 99-70-13A1]